MRSTFGKLLVFILILVGIFIYLKTGADLFEKVKGSVVQIEMKSIDRALYGNYLVKNSYPVHLKTFLQDHMENKLGNVGHDAFGTEYFYERRRNGYKIVSAGKNKTFGDKDDVILVRKNRDIDLTVASSGVKRKVKKKKVEKPVDESANEEPMLANLNRLTSVEELKSQAPRMTNEEFARFLEKFIKKHHLE